MADSQVFGERLRELRKERGLTQRALAQTIGLDFTYLSKIECGVASILSYIESELIAHRLIFEANDVPLVGEKSKIDVGWILELWSCQADDPR